MSLQDLSYNRASQLRTRHEREHLTRYSSRVDLTNQQLLDAVLIETNINNYDLALGYLSRMSEPIPDDIVVLKEVRDTDDNFIRFVLELVNHTNNVKDLIIVLYISNKVNIIDIFDNTLYLLEQRISIVVDIMKNNLPFVRVICKLIYTVTEAMVMFLDDFDFVFTLFTRSQDVYKSTEKYSSFFDKVLMFTNTDIKNQLAPVVLEILNTLSKPLATKPFRLGSFTDNHEYNLLYVTLFQKLLQADAGIDPKDIIHQMDDKRYFIVYCLLKFSTASLVRKYKKEILIEHNNLKIKTEEYSQFLMEHIE